MSDEKWNFSKLSNGQKCSCGKHHGVGEWSPQKRAAVYARMRDRLPAYLEKHMVDYLTTWEAQHGPVKYTLVPKVLPWKVPEHYHAAEYVQPAQLPFHRSQRITHQPQEAAHG